MDQTTQKQWKIERRYLKPCAPAGKSLKGLVIEPKDVNQYFLVVHEPKSQLRGTNVLKYIEYGEKIDAQPSKRRKKPIPLPEVETVKGRRLWYELPEAPSPSIIFPMWFRYQYRPLVNNANVHTQDFYYCIVVDESAKYVMSALLYATLTQFFLELNGRQYSGMLHTKVYQLKQLLVPDPSLLTDSAKGKLVKLFWKLNEVKVKQKEARQKLEQFSSKIDKAVGLFEQEAREEYEKLKSEEKKITSEMDEVVYDFLGLPNKDRITIKEALTNLREIRKLATRGLKIKEEG